jgi:hypothetical protein
MSSLQRCFALLIAQLVLIPLPAYALLGDSPAKCDTAYGKPIVSIAAPDLEFRSYDSAGCRIRVVFAHGTSAVEQLTLQPTSAEAAMLFLQSLLSTQYGFTDRELAELTHVTQTGDDDHITSSSAHGIVRVACTLDVGREPLRFVAVIGELQPAAETQRIRSFLLDATRREAMKQLL